MKKTVVSILSIVMVLTLVLAAAPAAIAAEAHPHTETTAHCACGNAADSAAITGHTHAEAPTWEPWPGYTLDGTKAYANVTEGGHYYLTADVARATDANGAELANIIVNKAITLCLNGYTFNNKLEVNADLTITDCAPTPGKMVSYDGAKGRQGGVLQIKAGTVNLFNAELVYAGDGVNFGGVVAINADNTTFNMFSGKLSGGKYHADAANGFGGSVFVGDGATRVFNFYGGTISGGVAKDGGNIYVRGAGQLNLYGGVITGGTSDGDAEIYLSGTSTMNVKNLGASVTVFYKEGATINTTGMDSSLTWPASAAADTVLTLEKAGGAPGGNPSTGNSTLLSAMALVLTMGVVGVTCLVSKKKHA